MNDNELMLYVCNLQKRMNEIFFQFKNNSSDGLENLSDLFEQYLKNTGKKWDATITYEQTNVVSYNNKIYVSLLNSNLNKNPETEPTYWKFINTKNLEFGEFYMSGFCSISQPTLYNHIDNYQITSSYNILSLEYYNDGLYKLTFDPACSIFDKNYLVFTESYIGVVTADLGTTTSVFNNCNIVQKTENYLLFKVTHGRYISSAINILILTQQ